MVGDLTGTHIEGINKDGKACFKSAESFWAEQQILWENRQIVRGYKDGM